MKTISDSDTLAMTMNQIARHAYQVLRHSGDRDEIVPEAFEVIEAISRTRGQLPYQEADELHRWLDRLQTDLETRLQKTNG
ncbi:hypothetical protein BH23PLA1_BH23PLA1_25290 [soil metagenome]